MVDEIIVTVPVATVVESIGSTTTVENVTGTSSLVEANPNAVSIVTSTPNLNTLEVAAQTTLELETAEATVSLVEATTGPTGYTPQLYSGAAPPDDGVGTVGDLYLVNTGATIGDLYQKTKTGWGVSKGNLRGGIASVNGISGTNVVLSASNITTGVLPIAQVPTGTTGTTVALGNHLHTGVYEPAITGGLTTQYWRGDKTWVVIDKASIGLGSVPDVDTTNATNISSGTLAIGRIPTGTTGTTVALGNHNHDSAYVALTGTQTIAGAKTFSSMLATTIGGTGLQLQPGAQDHVYMAWNARTSSPGTRSAYVGYGGAAATTFSIVNEITNGSINLQANGSGQINLNAAGVAVQTALTTPALRVGTSATAGYVLTADASGNATWQQTANIIIPGTTSQYYRGDLTWQTLDKAALGLANVTNSAQVDLTTNQTIAGTKSFTSEIVGATTGNVLKVGDDARIADVNIPNYIAIIGIQTPTTGGISFGGSSGFKIEGNNTGGGTITAVQGLFITGALSVNGTISGDGSGLTSIPAANLTGTMNFNQLPVGSTGTTVAAGNHNHSGVYEPVIAIGSTAQYYRGDKSWQTLNAAAVGLGNVANSVQVDLTSGQTITGAKAMTSPSNAFSGSGALLTALNASQLQTGTVPQARTVPNIQRFFFTTGSESRPSGTTYVEWVGPVAPSAAVDNDTWTDTSVGVVEDPLISMPIGTIIEYGGTGSPTNWLPLNGAAISRTDYSALFTLQGTLHGSGDGSTTFNLENRTTWVKQTGDTGWIAAPYANGWTDWDSVAWAQGGYRKINGIVYLRGLVRSGTLASPIFTLPAGFRPAQRYHVSVMGHASAHAAINIFDDGRVQHNAGLTVANQYLSLDAISFPSDATTTPVNYIIKVL